MPCLMGAKQSSFVDEKIKGRDEHYQVVLLGTGGSGKSLLFHGLRPHRMKGGLKHSKLVMLLI